MSRVPLFLKTQKYNFDAEMTFEDDYVRLPLINADVTVDWGDGTINNETIHTYSSSADYLVKIKGNAESFSFLNIVSSRASLRTVTKFHANGMDKVNFYGCPNITSITNIKMSNILDISRFTPPTLTTVDISNIDTSNTINMSRMFGGCRVMTALDLSNFDTSKVTDMSNMFWECESLTTLNVSNFNTSNVTTMFSMFSKTRGLTTLDLSNFDTSKVTDMRTMFYDCESLTTIDVSNFNVSNVTTMYYMYEVCDKITTPAESSWWDGSNPQITDHKNTFRGNTSRTNYASIPADWK